MSICEKFKRKQNQNEMFIDQIRFVKKNNSVIAVVIQLSACGKNMGCTQLPFPARANKNSAKKCKCFEKTPMQCAEVEQCESVAGEGKDSRRL